VSTCVDHNRSRAVARHCRARSQGATVGPWAAFGRPGYQVGTRHRIRMVEARAGRGGRASCPRTARRSAGLGRAGRRAA
jgi:hypothetical protein